MKDETGEEFQLLIEQLATGISLEGEFDSSEALHHWMRLRELTDNGIEKRLGLQRTDPRFNHNWVSTLIVLVRQIADREVDMRTNGNLEDIPEGSWSAALMGNFAAMMEETTNVQG